MICGWHGDTVSDATQLQGCGFDPKLVLAVQSFACSPKVYMGFL